MLSQSGTLDLAQAYLGGWVDAATGLIYVGDGQYYDPTTGRFLTREAQPGKLKPLCHQRRPDRAAGIGAPAPEDEAHTRLSSRGFVELPAPGQRWSETSMDLLSPG